MRNNLRNIVCSLAALAAWIALPSLAGAQVVIDMPPPPKKTFQPTPLLPAGDAPDAASTTITTSSSVTMAPAIYPVSVQGADVGQIALARYSDARYGTYDTYTDDGSYFNGYRMNSYYYPQYWSGWGWPWWGGVGFFPFGFHGGCHFNGSHSCK